jgi:hypothetical protein
LADIENGLQEWTTVLSVMFVLTGLIFLVSVPTENALASTFAYVHSLKDSEFKLVIWSLSAGKFVADRFPDPDCDGICYWATEGNGIFGDEQGYVKYEVTLFQQHGIVRAVIGHGIVTFLFNNPLIWSNTCNVHAPSDLAASCSITQAKAGAEVNYDVEPNSPISPLLGVADPGEDGN